MAQYTDTLAQMMAEQKCSPSTTKYKWSLRDKSPFQFIRNAAVFTPSYQPAYARVLNGHAGRALTDFPEHLKSTTYLNPMLEPGQSAYWWPRMLFSVVDDALKPERFEERYGWMLQLSDMAEVTFDSGGFHVAKGTVTWTPNRVAGTIRLVEKYADWALTLDHPTFTGHEFAKCLKETIRNLNILLKHRTGNAKWLNICQGSDIDAALAWNADVRFAIAAGLEGIAYAVLGMPADVMLELMRKQIDDGDFDKLERVHLLGRGKPAGAILFTIIKRILQKEFNPDFEVTFDTATAFRDAGHQSIAYNGLQEPIDEFGASIVRDFNKIDARCSIKPAVEGEPRIYRDPNIEIFLNSPVYPPNTPIKLSEICQTDKDGNLVSNLVGMSTFAANNMWHQIQQLLSAYDEVDQVFHLPSYYKYSEVNPDVLLQKVVKSLKRTSSIASVEAELTAALRQIDLDEGLPSEIQYFKHHHLERFQIAQEAVREILVGDKPDIALTEHQRMFANWFGK